MKKEDISKREKSAAVGLVVCFVAMIAIVGMITFSQYQRRTESERQQLAEAETDKNTKDMGDVANNDMDAPFELNDEDEEAQTANADEIQAEIEKPDTVVTPNIVITPAPNDTLYFAVNDVLSWPVDGNVILGYNMDSPVYFSTLDQYKYNPAIIIGGEVGDEVSAAAVGEVTSIKSDAKTGTTITMNLGNGYVAVYGQLKDVCVKEGERVEKGEVIGYLSEPTKYFSVEGPNLYFQLLKDGAPVNPMEYMEA